MIASGYYKLMAAVLGAVILGNVVLFATGSYALDHFLETMLTACGLVFLFGRERRRDVQRDATGNMP